MPFDENAWACQLGDGSHALAVSVPRAGRAEPSSAPEVIQPSARLSNGLICAGAILAMPLGLSYLRGYKRAAQGLNQHA